VGEIKEPRSGSFADEKMELANNPYRSAYSVIVRKGLGTAEEIA
jgi:hypothetical protein